MIYYDTYTYKTWTFVVAATDKGLYRLSLIEDVDTSSFLKESTKVEPYIKILDNYFKGSPIPKTTYDLKGSPFEVSVWHALTKVPYGKTSTYKGIGEVINHPKAYQAVGNAVGKNPVMIFIPCHRIIKSDNTIGGFSSDPKLKVELLMLEKRFQTE